ncbi:MAG TPA: ADOP family duplicated permease, partial [Gemmatimonadaceae bacterium]
YATGTADLSTGGSPEQVAEAAVSGGVFPALGTRAAIGRTIDADDDRPGAPPVAVVTYGLWTRRFGADSAAVGRPMRIDGHSITLIGVLPPGFRLPLEMATASPSEVFIPLQLDRDAIMIRGSHYLSSVASLKPGVGVAAAEREVAAVARSFSTRYPSDYPAEMRFVARAVDLRASIVGGTRPLMLLLLAAVGCVFLIACVNAANLLLANAESRRVEMTVRVALGAARWRLVRQLLAESLMLATLAGGLGIGAAALSTRLLAHLQPMRLPRVATLTMDWRVVVFALATTFIAAAAAALLPARRLLAASDLQTSIRAGGRGSAGTAMPRDARRLLVVGEIAAAAVLLLSAGLLVASFRRLLAVDPGFRVSDVLTVPVALPADAYPADRAVVALYDALTRSAAALPGARSAGAVAGVPLSAPRGDMGIEFEGHPVPPGGVHPKADWQVVTPGYFDAIGMRLRAGRFLTGSDRADTRGVVVVNETMARRYWPRGSALGQRFKLGGGAKPDTVTVVGVVQDVRQAGLARAPDPEMYLAQSQFRFWGGGGMERDMSLVVHTAGDPLALADALRRSVQQVAPSVALGPMRTMRDLRSASVAEPRFMMALLLASAAVAVLIAGVGVYGLVAFRVQQRRREFGMRIALGAQAGQISRMVLADCGQLAALGVLVGVPAGIGFARLLRQWLFGVTTTDPVLLAGVPVALGLLALVAGYLPARRAAHVDPAEALRAE